MRRVFAVLLALAVWCAPTHALPSAAPTGDPRPRDLMDGAELRLALRKLQVMGTALYVAAHPDDENSAFLAWLSRDRMVRAGYLSMTRGDGGQNLIGIETGAALGVIRTHELLQARRIDGAEQFFTRAVDFGFSKNPDETLSRWGHDAILADVVWVIRRFRPDVIVTRFGTDGSGGHGHHTASAILAGEAFRAASDPARFPEQLRDGVTPWRPRRIVWNNWRAQTEGRDPALPPIVTLDLGAYNALLGRSYGEIAGQSRSLHKSQGFGAPERRGANPNFFEHVDGEPAKSDLFEGVDLTWSRVRGGARVGTLLREAERAFDPDRPAAILPKLFEAHAAMTTLEPDPLVDSRRRELLEVIRSCAGLWVEAIAARPTASPGATLPVALTVLDRSGAGLAVEKIELPYGAAPRFAAGPDSGALADRRIALEANRAVTLQAALPLPADLPLGGPYWLREPPLEGAFRVADPSWIGLPENPPLAQARVTLGLGSQRIALDVPVVYKWTDPVQGERYRPLEVVPPVTARFEEGVTLFSDATAREVRVVVESAEPSLAGTARLRLPPGWRATPAEAAVQIAGGGVQRLAFRVTPPGAAAAATVGIEIETAGHTWSSSLQRIDHPHIPVRTLLPAAEARLVRADVRHTGEQIGYLMGSGDQVPEALRQMGFRVTLLTDDDVEQADLDRFDAIVSGVRAYNTRPRLIGLQPRLLDYVARGGRLVVQYNTAEKALENRLGPWPFAISRDRVTVEEAEMRRRDPHHPLLDTPNRIEPSDFDGWVQERGLYFASPWDSRYETVLSANDPGETPKDGGLLFARHGKGVFIYTGLAWFRQLPAGVPGAYRLFANLVSAVPGS